MLILSCEPQILQLSGVIIISRLCGLLYFFLIVINSLYSSGHQIFMCVFELGFTLLKNTRCCCLQEINPVWQGNKYSQDQEQQDFLTTLLITHDLNQLFNSSIFTSLNWGEQPTLILDNVEKH